MYVLVTNSTIRSCPPHTIVRIVCCAYSIPSRFMITEVVTTGSPKIVTSWIQMQRSSCSSYIDFMNGMYHKIVLIPCWIALLHSISYSRYFVILQYATILTLMILEVLSTYDSFQSYFTTGSVHVSPLVDFHDPNRRIRNDDQLNQVLPMLEMIGTILFLVSSLTRYIGLFVLVLVVVPCAYESFRRRMIHRVLYVMWDDDVDTGCHSSPPTAARPPAIDHHRLQFWMAAAKMGSQLLVGVSGATSTMMSRGHHPEQQLRMTNSIISTIRLLPCVHAVITGAPTKVDLMFLEKFQIDYVVLMNTGSCCCTTQLVTDETIQAKRVLMMGDDGIVRLAEPKMEGKKE
jgi:glycerol-3-phosphate cytidylyltransferase-like family protein